MSTKDLVLDALMENRGSFLSGEELSNELGVSRTAVWKAINALRRDGYEIDAVTNKGYLLKDSPSRMDADTVYSHLPPEYRDITVEYHDDIDSTNIRAKKLAADGAPHGTVVIAGKQTQGRGRLGRSFFSPSEGLYMSIIVRPAAGKGNAMLVTSAAAVAVAEAIEHVSDLDARIKWVNDIYADGKKVCGILTEGVSDLETGSIEYMVIGIGINTSTEGFPDELLKTAGAVSGAYSRAELAANVIWRTLLYSSDTKGSAFMDAYRKRSLLTGKEVTVYKGRYKVNPEDEIPGVRARVLDIDDDGGLVVLYADGTQEKLISGEVSLRL